MIISQIQKKYFKKIDSIDLDLIISHVIKKGREFVLAHPEYLVTSNQQSAISKMIKRRMKNEPLAYILGEKEFYGLNFKVNKHTLIPRPETELMMEMALGEILNTQYSILNTIDVGTGSGNIIISLAHSMKHETSHMEQEKFPISNFPTCTGVATASRQFSNKSQIKNPNLKNKENKLLSVNCKPGTVNYTENCEPKTVNYFAIDISQEALKIAKQNAKFHNVHKKIKFLHGDLLNPIIKNLKLKIKNSRIIILANLPYLSKEIYNACTTNVKKYEPKTALYSSNSGLSHYNKLLKQIFELKKDCSMLHVSCFMEISPEQKKLIPLVIKKYFPQAKIEFKKDLAQKWRVCKIEIK